MTVVVITGFDDPVLRAEAERAGEFPCFAPAMGGGCAESAAHTELLGGGMRRGPEDLAFSATASCVMLATSAALLLIVYALLTLIPLLSSGPLQQLVGTTF